MRPVYLLSLSTRRMATKSEFALAEHEVLVFAVANVFDVDVADEVGELAVDLTERRGLGAEDVADVHRQAEPGAGDMFFEDLEFGHVIDEHSRSGSKASCTPRRLECSASCRQPVTSQSHA